MYSQDCHLNEDDMVVNLCLPHFNTTISSNKLCADGYDVTNLVAVDPALRRRGFKLEYFLRPPVQVTLTFGFKVELCRVDVELWPWGMDQGQCCKRLEISTSSDTPASRNDGRSEVREKGQEKEQRQNQREQSRRKQQRGDTSQRSNGRQWSMQAQQWGDEATAQQSSDTGNKKQHSHSSTESSCAEPQFRLVGRCELREETQVCFSRVQFSPRPPFVSPPPQGRAGGRQEELWSRGPFSLGSVTQLRVTVPFGGAASALGLKALAVWGQPSRCCHPEEVERIKKTHEDAERRIPRNAFFASPVQKTKQAKQTPGETASSSLSIPEEFLDPITQEVMALPMLLPSGVSVDSSTLDEYQKREATWGRPQNDPFTGVPFSAASQPLPNPQLKTRIDRFLLQGGGSAGKDGVLGRRADRGNPLPSRLVASVPGAEHRKSQCPDESNASVQCDAGITQETHSPSDGNNKSNTQVKSKEEKKRHLCGFTEESPGEAEGQHSKKRLRNADSVASSSSHEQRLSASLDEALLSVLSGRPSFTSNLSSQKQVTPVSEPLHTAQQGDPAGGSSATAGEKTCSACFRAISVYSSRASPVYRLTCGHLLCSTCLRGQSPASHPHILCSVCQSPTPRSDVMRVHH